MRDFCNCNTISRCKTSKLYYWTLEWLQVHLLYAHVPNVGIVGLVKNSCLHKVFPAAQKENILLLQYKPKLIFKAGTVNPNWMKQKIFITWSTEEGIVCAQICLWKICLQEHVCACNRGRAYFWEKGVPWRFHTSVLMSCPGDFLYWFSWRGGCAKHCKFFLFAKAATSTGKRQAMNVHFNVTQGTV